MPFRVILKVNPSLSQAAGLPLSLDDLLLRITRADCRLGTYSRLEKVSQVGLYRNCPTHLWNVYSQRRLWFLL